MYNIGDVKRDWTSMIDKVVCAEALEFLSYIPDQSIDMILCDLPYGTTACKWDIVIEPEKLWTEFMRVIKSSCAIVLFGREPFTSSIVYTNIKNYKHKWIWNKKQSGSYQNAKWMPLQIDEDIVVFGKGKVRYFPQMRIGKKRYKGGARKNTLCGKTLERGVGYYSDKYYPINIIDMYNPKINRFHPTEKPVKLCEYLIKTYTLEDDLVLDCCAGAFTTMVACKNINRRFIGCDINEEYCQIAEQRI